MTAQVIVDQAAREAFKAVRARARTEHGGNTQQLLVVYAVESFLRRLSISDYAHQMVLKGGMLMAASRIREMTKDADLSTHGIVGDEGRIREVVAQICALTPDPHDGIQVDPATIRTETVREQDEYQGVRCKLVATLGQAQIPFALGADMPDRQQAYEAMVERMSYLAPTPQRWTELIDGVIEFVDPLLADQERLSRWDPETLTWH
ncbi:MAG TPA: nucleotidyl transferase AbiEii/AbiGii toxin family protein [Solirubrobacterales bacterium]|nr:nucleotidyl transferase AbiEii/AbiGii toxin family protein [Solirubrobacterales bacterium]